MIQLDKQSAHRLLQMVESGLVSYRYTMPWADDIIIEQDEPPAWVCELSTARYQGKISGVLREYIFSEPIKAIDTKTANRYYVGCLFLRYSRGEISWATCLEEIGKFADGTEVGKPCEFFFGMLNDLEDAEYDHQVEEAQVQEILAEYNVVIDTVKAEYEPFLHCFRKQRQKR